MVSRAQLVRAGLHPATVNRLLRAGRLHPIHAGVYRVGPLLSPYAGEMAAVLACGDGAVLSHQSAARCWEVLPRSPRSTPVVAVPHGRRVRRDGLTVHRVGPLAPDEVTRRHGLPITAPARTVLDLAGVLEPRDLERAFGRTIALDLTDLSKVASLLERYPKSRGAATLRALVKRRAGPAMTESPAEDLFLDLARKAKLTEPDTNVTVCGFRVDIFWPVEKLVVEIDSYQFHSSPERFENDRQRDAVLAAAGVRVLRVTWRQLTNEPEALIVRVAQALARTAGVEWLPAEAQSPAAKSARRRRR